MLWRCSRHCARSGQGGLRVLERYPKSGCVAAVLGGAMISVWAGCWRSWVPSFSSSECVEGVFSDVYGPRLPYIARLSPFVRVRSGAFSLSRTMGEVQRDTPLVPSGLISKHTLCENVDHLGWKEIAHLGDALRPSSVLRSSHG